jgi:hypothetical protein
VLLQLPLLLFQQHHPILRDYRGVLVDDNCAAKRSSRCKFNPLLCCPDLASVVLGEVAESQHLLFGLLHEPSSLG